MLEAFYKKVVRNARVCDTGHIRAFMEQKLFELANQFVSQKNASELHKQDVYHEFKEFIASPDYPKLADLLFGTGINFVSLNKVRLESGDYEKQEEIKKRIKEEEQIETKRMEMKKKISKEILSDEHIQRMLSMITEPAVKDIVCAKLISEDVGKRRVEDVLKKFDSERVKEKVFRILESILAGGGEPAPHHEIARTASKSIFVVTGRKVIEFAKRKIKQEVECEQPLRSVKVQPLATNERWILCGGKTCVYVIYDDKITTYAMPFDKIPRGGINSVEVYRNYILATHSELGLCKWAFDQKAEGVQLAKEMTREAKVIRGVCVFNDNIYFSCDNKLVLYLFDEKEAKVLFEVEKDERISSFCVTNASIFAGTEGGKLVRWDFAKPGAIEIVVERGKMIDVKIVKVGAIPHIIYSARQRGVYARVVGHSFETVFEARGANMGQIDATSDLIAGIDETGYTLMMWDTKRPRHPSVFDLWKAVSKPALDIFIAKHAC
jgi:hypothetical protein